MQDKIDFLTPISEIYQKLIEGSIREFIRQADK